ncbi:MAG: hypothetical protein U0514_00305 [Candidatus Andersenbacteria bacterium]
MIRFDHLASTDGAVAATEQPTGDARIDAMRNLIEVEYVCWLHGCERTIVMPTALLPLTVVIRQECHPGTAYDPQWFVRSTSYDHHLTLAAAS